jgi:hypothetical protein
VQPVQQLYYTLAGKWNGREKNNGAIFKKKKSRGENEGKQKSTQTQMKLTHRKNPPVRKIPQSEKE